MGLTETRNRVSASSAHTPMIPTGAPTQREELVQDRVARYRLEKRLKRRKAQKRRQNVAVAIVMFALFGMLLFLGLKGLGSSRFRSKKGTPQERAESLHVFHKDAPHAKEKGVKSHPKGGFSAEKGSDKNRPKRDASHHTNETASQRTRRLELEFEEVRGTDKALVHLKQWAHQVNRDIADNVAGGIRFIRSYLLPPFDDVKNAKKPAKESSRYFMSVHRANDKPMKWEGEWKDILRLGGDAGPIVDYTNISMYTYPNINPHPPEADSYPVLTPLGKLMEKWNHDKDYNGIFHETLMHFNYSNLGELEMAMRYRDAKLPFKLYDIPELKQAGEKWTDEYLAANFAATSSKSWLRPASSDIPRASGMAQESPNNYFAFFVPHNWDVENLGLPPVTTNDWTFTKWADHARYADSVRLPADKPHFYWQAGVPASERHKPQKEWTFISRDLPSMSSPTQTFFVWHPEEQKGIQCRFGERGVVAATHYDSGRNMVAMITGAKRYILSPPRACSKLGIFTSKHSPIYRHSLLNFAHIPLADDEHNHMSSEERAWLRRASTAEAIDTIIKAGEALFIPSHYFHYIISLQKSAQCNVRSGVDAEGHPVFGGKHTVDVCKDR